MYVHEIVQGSQNDAVLTAVARDGTFPTGFLATDVLSAVVWLGQNTTPIYSPVVSWNNFATGAFNIAHAPAMTAGLDYLGHYHCQVTATRTGTPTVIADFLIKILPAAGTQTDLVNPYCSYDDLLLHAPWLTIVQDQDLDQEGFYSQRLEAKNWFDWLIIRNWRGTSAAYFGDPGRAAQFWLGGWARRSPLPSQWLINQLAGGVVVPPITLTAHGSGYTYANVVFSGGGPNATQASAYTIVSGGQVISILLISNGYGYTSAPTITIVGDGTGATATCTVSKNVLMLRPPIVECCAYKAASIIGLGQIGKQLSVANYGAQFRDMASSKATGLVAELDLNGDGIADLPIPLSSTNTLFT